VTTLNQLTDQLADEYTIISTDRKSDIDGARGGETLIMVNKTYCVNVEKPSHAKFRASKPAAIKVYVRSGKIIDTVAAIRAVD
jgi:hypothetical protein